jgi:hypothetical protein
MVPSACKMKYHVTKYIFRPMLNINHANKLWVPLDGENEAMKGSKHHALQVGISIVPLGTRLGAPRRD